MAKQKASRPALKTAVKKRSGAKAAARSSARKAVKAKARTAAAKKPARPKQRIAVSHHREEDFKADGLRAYAKYRDLGIGEATRPRCPSSTITTSNSRWSTCSRAG